MVFLRLHLLLRIEFNENFLIPRSLSLSARRGEDEKKIHLLKVFIKLPRINQ